MKPSEILNALNTLDERAEVEAKTASKSAGRAIFKSILAFANTDGGWILCGVERTKTLLGDEYVVVGVDDPDTVQAEIQTGLNQIRGKIHIDQRLHKLDKKTVIVVRVLRREPQPTHAFFEKDGYPDGVYLRKGSTDYKCNEADIPYLTEKSTTKRHEESVVEGANFDHFDTGAIRNYRKLRMELDVSSEERNLNETEFLECRSAIVESKGRHLPTVCGILLFGNAISISRFYPNARLVYFRLPGIDYRTDLGQRDGDLTLSFEGNLISVVQGSMAQVLSDMVRYTSYSSDEPLTRRETTTLEARIVRESLVNAVTHRSYHESAPVQISRYANRLCIQNPGHSLMPLVRLGANKSRCRNEKIAAGFRSIKWAENLGLGIGTLRNKMKEAGLPEPVFDDDVTGNFFTTILVLEPFNETEVRHWMEAFAPNHQISPMDPKIMFFAREIRAINQSIVQSIDFCEPIAAASQLRTLERAGFLTKHGTGDTRYFTVASSMMNLLDNISGTYVKSEAGSVKSEAGSVKSEAESPRKPRVDENDDPFEYTEMPKEVEYFIDRVSRRSDRDIVRKAILLLCEWRPMKLAEIANFLNRSQNTLYRDYIGPMTIDKQLRLYYQDAASHPDQRYVTTSSGSGWLSVYAEL